MTNAPKPLTASAIKYLLILLELCKNETGARCMDIAGQLHVTKPSVHSMIGNLCSAGLAEKKKYGNVFLTPAGRAEAERYAGCCQQLSGRMQQSLGLNAEDAHSAACAVLAQLPRLPEQLQTRKEGASGAFDVCFGSRRDLRLHRRGQGRLPETEPEIRNARGMRDAAGCFYPLQMA